MSLIAKNIRYLRKKHKMSMDALAEVIDKAKSTVKFYEDEKSIPDSKVIQLIVNHFEVSYYSFFETDLEELDQIEANKGAKEFDPRKATQEQLEKEYYILKESYTTLQNRFMELKSSINLFIDSKLK